MMKSRNRLAARVSWLGLAVALAVTIAGPAGYFVVAYAEIQHELSFSAHLKANRLAKYIYSHRELWQYQIAKLNDLLDVPEAGGAENRQRVLDATGKLVLETGAAQAFPVTTTSAPIVVEQSAIGRVETAATLRGLLLDTGLIGLFSGFLGFIMFVTLRLLPIRIIDETTLRFETALDNMSRALCMFDADGRLLVVNRQYATLFGIPAEKIVLGMTEGELRALSVGDRSGSETAMAGEWSSHEGGLLYRADGIVIAGFREAMANGGVVATYEDITERSRAEEKIFHMARHDPLTELPNRRLFREEIDSALKHVGAHESVTVLHLGIDAFKNVNDTLGHVAGDGLLKQIATRLRGAVRAGDTVARVGGDEFGLVVTRVVPPFHAAVLAGRLADLIGQPYIVDGHEIVVGTSIGLALTPTDGSDADQLLNNANLALQMAKAEGRGTHRYFQADMDARVKQRHAVQMELRRAIAMEEFELFYQPILSVASEEIVGFEALLRWNHPERGLVPPNDFIPTAEATGQIVAIGEWAIRTACHEAATWPPGLTVAVNLSPIQIRSANLLTAVKAALASSGLPAGMLELEVTESVMLQDDGKTMRVMSDLHDLGLRISMDDFGTGYSSLTSLRKFPFDRIKIDRSFVSEMADRVDSLAIVRAVSAIGASMRMATTAEGVETREQFERVKEEGCTEAQGYLFSRPRPAGDIPALLASNLPWFEWQAEIEPTPS
jgi:diguanylate cyclase (GGDEF)-like protein/PAS domain S-box-containing protein